MNNLTINFSFLVILIIGIFVKENKFKNMKVIDLEPPKYVHIINGWAQRWDTSPKR